MSEPTEAQRTIAAAMLAMGTDRRLALADQLTRFDRQLRASIAAALQYGAQTDWPPEQRNGLPGLRELKRLRESFDGPAAELFHLEAYRPFEQLTASSPHRLTSSQREARTRLAQQVRDLVALLLAMANEREAALRAMVQPVAPPATAAQPPALEPAPSSAPTTVSTDSTTPGFAELANNFAVLRIAGPGAVLRVMLSTPWQSWGCRPMSRELAIRDRGWKPPDQKTVQRWMAKMAEHQLVVKDGKQWKLGPASLRRWPEAPQKSSKNLKIPQ